MLSPLLLAAALVAVVRAILVPGPIGAFPVAMRTHELIDFSRVDPYASRNHTLLRRILVSVFLPLDPVQYADAKVQQLPYMPPLTAAEYSRITQIIAPSFKGVFEKLAIEYRRLETNDPGREYATKKKSYPVVIFSPGLGASRLMYSAGARDLASQGYIVITIDHPYDASIVEFPDGSVVRGVNFSTTAQIAVAAKVRVQDVVFLVNQLHDSDVQERLTEGFPGLVNVEKMAIYGHSLGGATAAEALRKDSRLLGGMNWDGEMQEAAASHGLAQPFIQVGVPRHRYENNSNWPAFYEKLRGPKLELMLENTTHISFTDLPLLLSTMEVPLEAQPSLEYFLGTVSGRRLRRTLTGILKASLEFLFERNVEGVRSLAEDYCGVTVF
ncbi:Platelet-activating factor acetylhydrolase [Ophiocordyceps camponoti-floridani]|uniref:1-alkyl-2-acetylglycerophosphocholine esterase n=1 Tax=Ophiocordyceps camponoti-floridani TaxID=2030778 RepID=A0A8H4Q779_9HYPO|nr:Platelet-activating factor acetylhydrolase [Ophiocordyceps camponoti-floridani]